MHVRYSQPGGGDRLGTTHDGEGHVTIEALKRLLPFGDYDFYLCGPPAFMQSLYDGLTGIGVRRERIHYESFGAGTVLKPETPRPTAPARSRGAHGAVPVRFAKSDGRPPNGRATAAACWSSPSAVGLAPVFGCRSGICGTCTTRISSGTVDYIEEPLAPRGDRRGAAVLLGPARPATDGIVLDL